MALAGAASLYVSAPARAAGRAGDAAATRAYLRAGEAYARAASAEVEASVAAIGARASGIAGECPSALTYAPRDGAFGELGEEINTTLFSAGVAPMSVIRLTFARAISDLNWSDRRLTRLAHEQAAEEIAWVDLAQPDVCADIAAWRLSAYAALPQSASSFLAHTQTIESSGYFEPYEESVEAAIKRLFRKYEGPVERRMATQIQRRERRTDMILERPKKLLRRASRRGWESRRYEREIPTGDSADVPLGGAVARVVCR